jgi:hypothetical protein
MTVQFLRNIKPLAGLVAIAAIAACSDSTSASLHPVKLNVTTKVASGPAAFSRIAADLTVGNSTLVLQKVELVVDKLELNENESTSCVAEIEASGDDHGEAGEECEDVDRDPMLLSIPVDDQLHTVLNIPLPAGTFSKLEAKLEPARDDATAFNTANAGLVGKSVRVTGTFGNPAVAFTFTSSVRTGLEMSFDPALVIDGTTATNATVSIDVAKWFIDSSNGNAVIDPNTATPGSAALQKIEDNIRRSFHAFEDDHESGIDDHEGHH